MHVVNGRRFLLLFFFVCLFVLCFFFFFFLIFFPFGLSTAVPVVFKMPFPIPLLVLLHFSSPILILLGLDIHYGRAVQAQNGDLAQNLGLQMIVTNLSKKNSKHIFWENMEVSFKTRISYKHWLTVPTARHKMIFKGVLNPS